MSAPVPPKPEASVADPEFIASLREELERARATVRENHRQMPGLRAARLYAYSVEQLLIRYLDEMAKRLKAEHLRESLSLVAVGGFGRQELGLYSDIDFVFISEREPTAEEQAFMKAVIVPLWDLRVDLGYGVHSVRDCLEMLGKDLSKITALLALRHLWGSDGLTEELQDRLQAKLHKHYKLWFVQSLEQEMHERHSRHGDTVFLLEPDVKLSRGGLRDIHQILWIAFAAYGISSFEVLVENGLISEAEKDKLLEAWSFLIDVRNSLHLLNKRRVDKLTLERQIKVADELNFEETEYALKEEGLMRSYYDHASQVERIGTRVLQFLLAETPGTPQSVNSSDSIRRIDRDFFARGTRIWIEDSDLKAVQEDRFWQMRLFLAAARENLSLTETTLRRVEQDLGIVDDSYRKSPVARDVFLTMMRTTGNLAPTLRAMHRCGFLAAYLPEFALVRNLPRIDHYHQFTVDEHLIRSVGVAEQMLGQRPPRGMEHVSSAAREVLRVDLLLLALLLHDVGKGEGRAHVIRGMHLVQRIAERFNLRPVEQDVLRNLVANHQKMSQIALRHDIENTGVVKELAQAVVDAEQLRMLYVHSAADMAGVSHESWNDWRARLMALLYERTQEELRGITPERTQRPALDSLREQIWKDVRTANPATPLDRSDLDHFLSDMPDRYLSSIASADGAKHFLLSSQLSNDNRIVYRLDSYEGNQYVELTFVARSAPGLFASLCGALASKRFNILSAQIYTAKSGEAVDIFQVEVPKALLDRVDEILLKIQQKMNHMLQTGVRKQWTDVVDRANVLLTEGRLNSRPPRVDINNETSPSHTVIEVRAPDRPGLLSEIAGVFDKFSVNIDLAFINTEGWQVVDVFYVTDLETNKLRDDGKMAEIEKGLLETIHQRLQMETPGQPAKKG